MERTSDEADRIAAELDAAHDRAHAAYAARDAEAYMSIFHPTLAYTHSDGRTIGREELARVLVHHWGSDARILSRCLE
jgi:hypothetical protein